VFRIKRLAPACVAALLLSLLGASSAAAAPENVAFHNLTPTTVTDTQPADPYPTTIDVSGMDGALTNATVTLTGLSQAYANKIDYMLVSPAGKTVMLLSDVPAEESGVNVTFDDAAPTFFTNPPTNDFSYKPTDSDLDEPMNSDIFLGGAPASPYGITMSALNGDDPNGTWKLYAAANGFEAGSPDLPYGGFSGWSLSLTTTGPPPVPPPAPTPTPTPTPTPPGPTQTGSTDIAITSVAFDHPPVAGQPATLTVVANDPKAALTGVIIDFGDGRGAFAESACVLHNNKPGSVTFTLPYTYPAAGDKIVRVTLIAGGCGSSTTRTATLPVTVAPPGTTTHTRAAPYAASSSTCPDANLIPTVKVSKRIDAAVLCLMNQQRALAHRKPLKPSKRLAKAALRHTMSMVAGPFFSHQGPKEPGFASRLKKLKPPFKSSAAENIGAGTGPYATPAQMVDAWMHSPPHRTNMLSPLYKAAGVGFLPSYPQAGRFSPPLATFTVDFGAKP
jgi:uncharacterized protein YkwD